MWTIGLMTVSVVTLLFVGPVQAEMCTGTRCTTAAGGGVSITRVCDYETNQMTDPQAYANADYFWRTPAGNIQYIGSEQINCPRGNMPPPCNAAARNICDGNAANDN